tara:strand:+ start:869 stop:1267 length:399 start_codon:yes stop_codon:yes gene_type:complete
MKDVKEKLTEATNSHLHRANGWELEQMSFRVVGLMLVRYKTKLGWTKWKKRWMELHEDEIKFYLWSKKREHYHLRIFNFDTENEKYTLEGVSCKDGFYIFTLTVDGKRKVMMRTPHETALTIFYPTLHKILD